MNFDIKEIIKFVGGFRGIWNAIKSMIGKASPLKIFNAMENGAREMNPKFAEALAENNLWNDIKRSNDFEQAADIGLNYATTLPFFQDKSKEDIKQWASQMGSSLEYFD